MYGSGNHVTRFSVVNGPSVHGWRWWEVSGKITENHVSRETEWDDEFHPGTVKSEVTTVRVREVETEKTLVG